MIDWSIIFDEAYPVAGASTAEVAEFTATIGALLSAAHIKAINRGQQNPFPKSDPLCSAYRPFDPSLWIVPNRKLPSSYLEFLHWSNGGEFRTGKRWFQFFSALAAGHGVRAMILAYHLPEYMPGALPFACNGGGTIYLFDMRKPALRGEYPIVCSHSGNLGWEPEECFLIAKTFATACRGTKDVDDLRFPP